MKVFRNLQGFNLRKYLLEMNIQVISLINKLSIMEKMQKDFGNSFYNGSMMDV
jgi:hypothetical protein